MAMIVINDGNVVSGATMNEYFTNTKYIDKPAGTTRTSTTTLTADPDLQIHLDTNKTYWMELIAPFTSPAAAGFKYSFFVPAGTLFTGYALVSVSAALTLFTYSAGHLLITANPALGSTSGGDVDDIVIVRGTLQTGGSAGNIGYQWAQQTSNVNPTLVRLGASMYIRRVS